jgi:predicted CXXCH cytochrome family protein
MIKIIAVFVLSLSVVNAAPFKRTDKKNFHKFKCIECHSQHEGDNVHKPVGKDCNKCHVKHEEYTPHKKFLKLSPVKLCLSCHEKDGYHKKNKALANHPVQGKQDILYPNKKFDCLSCHRPHSSSQKNLFRYNHNKKTPYKGNLCLTCHWSFGSDKLAPSRPDYNQKVQK